MTNLVEAMGMRGVVKEKRIFPKLGPITSQTEAKSRAAYETPAFTSPGGYFRGLFIYSACVDEHIPSEKNGASDQGVVQMHFGETETS